MRGRFSVAMLACAMPGLAFGQPRQDAVDPAWFVGLWSDHDDCHDAVDFRGDGSFRTAQGGEGRWTLIDGLLSLSGQGGGQRLRLSRVGPNQVSATNLDSNEPGNSWRCKAEGSRDNRTARPPAPPVSAAVTTAVPVAPAPPLTRAFLIGRWGVGPSCNESVVTFAADGTASPPAGTRWSMQGNVVTVTQPRGQPAPATITVTGPDGFRATPPGGGEIQFVRCPAAD